MKRNKIRKYIYLALAAILAVTLAGCGTQKDSGASNDDSSQKAAQDAEGRTAVVYFSATGHTRKVAKEIAKVTGADIYEIVPEKNIHPMT